MQEEQEFEERDKVFRDLINSMRRDFPTSKMSVMTDTEVIETAVSWSGHLKHVPANRIMSLYSALALGSKFPPTISDIADCWAETYFQESQRAKDAKRHREDEEFKRQNADKKPLGYQVFQMMGKRHAAGKDAVCCKCVDANGDAVPAALNQDGEWLKCQTSACDFLWRVEDFMNAPVAPTFRGASGSLTGQAIKTAPMPIAAPQKTIPVQLTDDELLGELCERCGLKFEEPQQGYWIKFAKWLQNKVEIDVWSASVARSMYEQYKREVLQAAA